MFRAKLVPELLCSNLQTSLRFYLELVGFRILFDRPDENFSYLDLGGAQLMLEEALEASDSRRTWWTAKPEKPYGRGINLQIEVADVDAIFQRLALNNWSLYRPLEEKWYRMGTCEVGNRQFLVQDPDGYLLRFFSDLGKRS